MADVTIRVKDNGPLLIEGTILVVDGMGQAVQLPVDKPAIALCRCGASSKKPFCDGSHRTSGFNSTIRCPETPTT